VVDSNLITLDVSLSQARASDLSAPAEKTSLRILQQIYENGTGYAQGYPVFLEGRLYVDEQAEIVFSDPVSAVGHDLLLHDGYGAATYVNLGLVPPLLPSGSPAPLAYPTGLAAVVLYLTSNTGDVTVDFKNISGNHVAEYPSIVLGRQGGLFVLSSPEFKDFATTGLHKMTFDCNALSQVNVALLMRMIPD
jgi:hypothetical protein